MTENLSDIFANVTDETPITAGANGIDDGGITVEIVNSANGARNSYVLYPENSLADVLDVCKAGLSIGSTGNQINFEFDGNTYSDPKLTVSKLGIVDGAKILVHPNGTVA